ncbi:MAG: hypothetical protein ABI175_08130, partial [Polyangiales bacterium]
MRSSLRAALVLSLPLLATTSYLACAPKHEHGTPAPIGSPADAFDLESFHPFGDADTARSDSDTAPVSDSVS